MTETVDYTLQIRNLERKIEKLTAIVKKQHYIIGQLMRVVSEIKIRQEKGLFESVEDWLF